MLLIITFDSMCHMGQAAIPDENDLDEFDKPDSKVQVSQATKLGSDLRQEAHCVHAGNNQCRGGSDLGREETYQKDIILGSILEQLELDQPPNITKVEADQLRDTFLPLISEEALRDAPHIFNEDSTVTEAWLHCQTGKSYLMLLKIYVCYISI